MKRIAKRLFSLLLTAAILCGLCLPAALAAESRYSDTEGHWAEAAIDRWSGYGVVQGSGGSFRPDGDLTRAQMATVLSNALGHTWGAWSADNGADTHSRVCGRDEGHRETEAHAWNSGVVTKEATLTEAGEKSYTCSACGGVKTEAIPRRSSDEQFALIISASQQGLLAYLELENLDGTIRLEMAKLMAAFTGVTVTGVSAADTPFTDCTGLTDQERGVIRAVCDGGVMAPTGQTTFVPSRTLTRAEAAEILYRALGRPETSLTNTFTDLGDPNDPNQSTHWAYYSIHHLYNLGLLDGASALDDTFQPDSTAAKSDVLRWLVAAKTWDSARTPVAAVTGAVFVKTPDSLRLEVTKPADVSDIERFRFALWSADREMWEDCGSFGSSGSGAPIHGGELDGHYSKIQVISIPQNPAEHIPSQPYETACDLTVNRSDAAAPASVAFFKLTSADSARLAYHIEVTGLSADTDQVIVELAKEADGRGSMSDMCGNNFFRSDATGKDIAISAIPESGRDYLAGYIPNGYYRVLEVEDASVNSSAATGTRGSTAALTVAVRGDWTQISASEATCLPVSNLRFEAKHGFPMLAWDWPATAPNGAVYSVCFSQDNGASWTCVKQLRSQTELPPCLLQTGSYNAVKVEMTLAGGVMAGCTENLPLTVKARSQGSAAVAALSGGDCQITGLTPNTDFTIFIGRAAGEYFRSIGGTADANGSCTFLNADLPSGETLYYTIQEYVSTTVPTDGKSAEVEMAFFQDWKQLTAVASAAP